MSAHRLLRVDFQRPAHFIAVCECGWRSEAASAAGLAGARWDDHALQAPGDAHSGSASIVDVDLAAGEAARELYAELVPVLKDAVRAGAPLTVVAGMARMEELAAALGMREARVAGAVRRQWVRLVEDDTARQRATVIVGLVELGERAREHLSRGLPTAPQRAGADSAG
jgi:hypothetical protein